MPHKCSIVLHFKAFLLLLIRACLHESGGPQVVEIPIQVEKLTCPSNLLFNLDHVFMIEGVTCQGQLLGLPAIHHVITSRLVNLPSWGLVHVKLFTSPPKTPSQDPGVESLYVNPGSFFNHSQAGYLTYLGSPTQI